MSFIFFLFFLTQVFIHKPMNLFTCGFFCFKGDRSSHTFFIRRLTAWELRPTWSWTAIVTHTSPVSSPHLTCRRCCRFRWTARGLFPNTTPKQTFCNCVQWSHPLHPRPSYPCNQTHCRIQIRKTFCPIATCFTQIISNSRQSTMHSKRNSNYMKWRLHSWPIIAFHTILVWTRTIFCTNLPHSRKGHTTYPNRIHNFSFPMMKATMKTVTQANKSRFTLLLLSKRWLYNLSVKCCIRCTKNLFPHKAICLIWPKVHWLANTRVTF